MGELFRRFWVPAFLSRELAEPDGTPARTRLLGEHIVGFRDTSGRLGILEAACPHRGVDLSFGINEENGLRCSRCGWKFDVEGNITDMPFEPDEEAAEMMKTIKAVAFGSQEWGGVVWAYMGPKDESAEMPQFEWGALPAREPLHHQVRTGVQLPAGARGRHRQHPHLLPLRHALWRPALAGDDRRPPRGGLQDDAPAHEQPIQTVAVKDDGLRPAGGSVHRRMAKDQSSWQLNQWLMPFYTTPKPEGNGLLGCLAWVPVDDRNTMVFAITITPTVR